MHGTINIKLTAYSCICWLFHRIYYDARNHKHKHKITNRSHPMLIQFNHIRVSGRAVGFSLMISRNLHPGYMSSHSSPCARPRRTYLCKPSSGTQSIAQTLQQSTERRNIPTVTPYTNYTVSPTKL